MLQANWRAGDRYTAPNGAVYPWRWLWDSCFHAVVWASLGDDRGRIELASLFEQQQPSGFVPHMAYQADPAASMDLWGVLGHSTITQPPMFGHAVRQLADRGFDVDALVPPARSGLRYFFRQRMTPLGLVAVWHPWETGADDNPRWERWQPVPFDRQRWAAAKQRLVDALEVVGVEAVGSRAFRVASASFNALVAWNALELAATVGDGELRAAGRRLARRIDEVLWDERLGTWVDRDASGDVTSTVRTLDALLPVLVTPDRRRRRRVLDAVVDPAQFGLPCGPAGVHPAEPCYDPSRYWGGTAWPQLTYLLWQAARQAGLDRHARILRTMLWRGAYASGFAEYWHPLTGEGYGARPQSWAALAAVPYLEDRAVTPSPPITRGAPSPPQLRTAPPATARRLPSR